MKTTAILLIGLAAGAAMAGPGPDLAKLDAEATAARLELALAVGRQNTAYTTQVFNTFAEIARNPKVSAETRRAILKHLDPDAPDVADAARRTREALTRAKAAIARFEAAARRAEPAR